MSVPVVSPAVPAYNPNLVNSKHRTIICILVIVACLIAYFIYKHNNKRPDGLPTDADTLAIFKKNLHVSPLVAALPNESNKLETVMSQENL